MGSRRPGVKGGVEDLELVVNATRAADAVGPKSRFTPRRARPLHQGLIG